MPCHPSGFQRTTHRRFFGEEDRDPPEAILKDLEEVILMWNEEGDVIMHRIDANQDTRYKKLIPTIIYICCYH
jgi:hypothetical protein